LLLASALPLLANETPLPAAAAAAKAISSTDTAATITNSHKNALVTDTSSSDHEQTPPTLQQQKRQQQQQPQHEKIQNTDGGATKVIDPDENDNPVDADDPTSNTTTTTTTTSTSTTSTSTSSSSYTRTASEAIHNEEIQLPALASSLPKTIEGASASTIAPQSSSSSLSSTESSVTKKRKYEDKSTVDDGSGKGDEKEESSSAHQEQHQGVENNKLDPTSTKAESSSNEKDGQDVTYGEATIQVDTDDDSSNNKTSVEKNLQKNQTLEGTDESKQSPPENEAVTTTAEPEHAASDEPNTMATLEKEEGSNEDSPKGQADADADEDEDDEEEENSLSRLSVDYASKSAGALIIEKSSSFKGTSNLLNGDKDKYAIAPCEEKKFVVVSLSEDILVKQIKLANYERFSSTVKDFQVMGSQTLGKWFDLGTYAAKPGNGEQTFDLLEPAWARYLKFKFLSHHGVEYYCTFSQIQVHGSTMVQGFHEQWEDSEDEDEQMEDLGMEDSAVVDAMEQIEGITNTAEDASLQEAVNPAAVETKLQTEANAVNDKATVTGEESESVASKAGGCAATSTCTLSFSSELDKKLTGALSDEEFFSSLYDLIPSTLNALPKASRNSPGRQTTSGDLRTLHQIGSLAMQSIYSTSKLASNAAKALISNSSDSIISTPKMTDRVGDAISQYLGTELGLLASMWDSHAAEDPTVKVSADVVEITTNETERPENKTSSMAKKQSAAHQKEKVKAVTEPEKEVIENESGHSEKAGETAAKSPEHPQKDVIQAQEGLNPTTAHIDPHLDLALAKMLESLPSSECLSRLDFSQFKAKMNASRKAHSGPGASTASGSSPMEPIFKKLTDEIKLLQSSLSVHDQFTKASVACYQRVLLDLIVETQLLRTDHEERLRNLENESRASWASSLWRSAVSIMAGFRTASSWIYSGVAYSYSPLLTWFSALFKVSLRIPGILYRRVLQRWPTIKNALLATGGGSSSLAKYLRPFTDQMDQLVVEMEIAETKNHGPQDPDDETWTFPVVPIVLLVLLGRLVMCFASPSSLTSNALGPSRREILAMKVKALSPSRIGRYSPSKKSPASTPTGGEKRVESSTTKPTQKDTPPPLVSEPAAALNNSRGHPPGAATPEPHRERPSLKEEKGTRIPQFRQPPRVAAANLNTTPSKSVTP